MPVCVLSGHFTTRQHTGRYTGYKHKQRAYDHIPIQTYDEACSGSMVGALRAKDDP
jgi:hypothetical protein